MMFLFSKVKLGLFLVVFSSFMAGLSAGSALYDGAWRLLFVAMQLFVAIVAFWGMSTRLALQVSNTASIVSIQEQSKLIVSLYDQGLILDPDFKPIADLSRILLEELEEAKANG